MSFIRQNKIDFWPYKNQEQHQKVCYKALLSTRHPAIKNKVCIARGRVYFKDFSVQLQIKKIDATLLPMELVKMVHLTKKQ